jgi:hypothetical protein
MIYINLQRIGAFVICLFRPRPKCPAQPAPKKLRHMAGVLETVTARFVRAIQPARQPAGTGGPHKPAVTER